MEGSGYNAEDDEGSASGFDSLVRAVAHVSDVLPQEPDLVSRRLGRFDILARLGAGGMGVVYAAFDHELRRRVALKVLPAALAGDPQRAHRFGVEAAALASLDHLAIVRYIAHGVVPTGEPFLAMEWLEGEDLGRRLRRGPLTVRASVALGLRAAEALAVAHARGIVHRDIKPSNLFLRGGAPEQVTLIDFGVAGVEGVSSAVTVSGAVIGTPGYMAPEQARGGARVDARADVFSLGCVLFECLMGEPAFAGPHRMAVLARILFDEPPRLRDKRPGVPDALSLLLDRMLAKSPEARPQDGGAVAAALRELGDLPEEALDEEPRDGRRREALTGGEQRAVAVILIGAPERREGEGEDAALRHEALAHGGCFDRLQDGSGVVLLSRTTLATDLAARAARCALRLRALAEGRSMALALGQGQEARRLPAGDAIVRAARLLEGSALCGAAGGPAPIIVDALTAGLLDARFDVRDGEHRLLLCGERELAEGTRTLLGKATPFVGRDRELRTLEQLCDECMDERTVQAVIVTAPAGAGKSRLAHEMLRRVRERTDHAAIWVGRGDPLRAGSAFGLLAQILRGAAGIREGEPTALLREKLARACSRVADRERRAVAELLGEIIGTPFPDDESPLLRAARRDPQIMKDRLRSAFLAFLAAECASRPVLIFLEDLHWGDRPTVQFLDRALKDLCESPLYVLALGRPELHSIFPRLWSERRLQQIHLGELTPRAIERLARHVLGERVNRDTLDRLVKLSEGNAFYLEELIRRAAEGRGADLPETVVAMVQSRIGALDDEAKRLLRAASIFGEVFWAQGVASLLGGDELASSARSRLRELIGLEVVVKSTQSRFPGQDELAFRHALLREGAYAMLTNEDRALGHRLAGEWLERHGEADPAVLARHFERGGEPERAAALYARAADRAIAGHDLEGALAHTERGLSCGAAGSVHGALLACKSFIHFWRADFEAADRYGTEALALLAIGSLRWCQCMGKLCLVVLQRDQLARVTALTQAFSRVQPAADALTAYVEAGTVLAVTWSSAGVGSSARGILARIEQVSRDASFADVSVLGWLKYGAAYYGYVLSPDPWSTYVAAQEALARFEEAGDQRMMANSRALLGAVQALLFGLATAEATLRAGITVMEQLKETVIFTYLAMFLALLIAEQGAPERLDEAHALAQAVLDKIPGPMIYSGTAYVALAHVHLRRGDLSAAEACAREGREILSMTPGMSPPAFVAHIEVLLRQGRSSDARAVAQEGIDLLRSVGSTGCTELRLRLSAAEARRADGDLDAAREAIEDAVKELYARADTIADGAARAHFLDEVPSHARLRELARRWRAG